MNRTLFLEIDELGDCEWCIWFEDGSTGVSHGGFRIRLVGDGGIAVLVLAFLWLVGIGVSISFALRGLEEEMLDGSECCCIS